MSKSSVHNAFGMIRVGNKSQFLKNDSNAPIVKDLVVNSTLVNARFPSGYDNFGASIWFNRPSKARYNKPSLASMPQFLRDDAYTYYQKAGKDHGGGALINPLMYERGNSNSIVIPVNDTAQGEPCAVGSLWAGKSYYSTPFPNISDGMYPERQSMFTAFSVLDVNGVMVGNSFKHQADVPSGYYFYVDSGDNALSQGNIKFGGHVRYPDLLLNHTIYQAYITKSGGTGTIDGTIGYRTSGEIQVNTAPTNDRFVDAGGVFQAADVGRYIAVRDATNTGNNYTFEILAFVDANTVEIDSQAVNAPVVAESSLNWTMRDGPIAEYFWRSRHQSKGSSPSSLDSAYYGTDYMYDRSGAINPQSSVDADNRATTVVNDGLGNYWAMNAGNTIEPAAALYRFTQMSLKNFDPTYRDGDIIGMPTGISFWSDMDVDKNENLWIAWAGAPDAPDADKVLAKIDPHPAGDARYPSVLALYAAQTTAADNAGLCSNNPIGVISDYINGRTFVLHGTGTVFGDDSDNGGISYTDDDGATWKRLHRLHVIAGESLDVTNGSATVTGGTALLSNFAVGDWIRFAADGESYEVLTVDSDAQITLASVYGGATASGVAVQKGMIDAEVAIAHFGGTGAPAGRCAADFDSTGVLYWVGNTRNYIARWDGVSGKIEKQYRTTISPTSFYGYLNLTISRMPNIGGQTEHPFHDNIWVGTDNRGVVRQSKVNFSHMGTTSAITGFADAGGGKVTVTSAAHGLENGVDLLISGTTNYNGSFILSNVTTDTFDIEAAWVADDASGTWSVIRTWYYTSASNYPMNVYIQYASSVTTPMIDRTTGAISIKADYYGGYPQYVISTEGDTIGRVVASGSYSSGHVPEILYASSKCFGRGGTGQTFHAYTIDAVRNVNGFMVHGPWASKGWNGHAWADMVGNPYDVDLDFDKTDAAPGPHVYDGDKYAPGIGTKRAMEIETELEYGLTVKFTQSGSVAQTGEFVIDEQTTAPVYIGVGKDNISDMELYASYFTQPTVLRQGVEPAGITANPWSVEGPSFETMGVDGGWLANSTSEGAVPTKVFGVAEPSSIYSQGYDGFLASYPDFNDYTEAPEAQYMATLRLTPEQEIADDYSVTATDTFESLSAYSFTSADLGKTIEIEGSAVGNNGPKVIVEILSATQVRVDSVFAATENSGAARRWKLTNIPAVGYVELRYHYANDASAMPQVFDFKLFSSEDRGVTWDNVKNSLATSGCADNDSLSLYEDEGVIFLASTGYQTQDGFSLIFDLTGLSEASRRRRYWKIMRHYAGPSTIDSRLASMTLRDSSFRLLGVPTYLRMADADDPQFLSSSIGATTSGRTAYRYMDVYDGSNLTIESALVSGATYTDTMLLATAGKSFYDANGTNGSVTVSGGYFLEAAATRTGTGTSIAAVSGVDNTMSVTVNAPLFKDGDVGRYLTLTGATSSERNDGTFLISKFISSTSVEYQNYDGLAESFTGTAAVEHFTQTDVGKKIRFDNAALSAGGTFTGFVVVSSFVSPSKIGFDGADLSAATGVAWALLSFGEGDSLYLDSDRVVLEEGMPLRDLIVPISDVPDSTTMVLASDAIPYAYLQPGVPFHIIRSAADGTYYGRPGKDANGTFTTGQICLYSPRFGTYFHSKAMEFIELYTGVSGTTAADSDGDGRTEVINIFESISDPGIGQVMPGDVLHITSSVQGEMYHTVTNISGGGDPDVTVALDDLNTSMVCTIDILRRRPWKMITLKSMTVTKETIA